MRRRSQGSKRKASASRSRERSADAKGGRSSRSGRDRSAERSSGSRPARQRSASTSSSGGSDAGSASDASDDLKHLSAKERRKEERRRKREAKAARKAEREARRAAKKKARAKETPAQRAARKAAKKKKQQETYFGYTNEDNPFGDSNLTKPFVWGKKLQVEAKTGKKAKPMSRKEFRRQQEANLAQIEKVKERRRLREIEQEERERLRQEEISLREAELYGDFEKKEKEFQKANAKVKTKIRIKDGRERPIDILAKNLLVLDKARRKQMRERGELSDSESEDELGGPGDGQVQPLEVDVQEPYLVMQGLPVSELQELMKDISHYKDVMKENPEYTEYWDALSVCCRDALEAARAQDLGKTRYDSSLPASIASDLAAMFDNKYKQELEAMRPDIAAMAQSGDAGGDEGSGYWKAVLQALDVHIAKAKLQDFHRHVLETRLGQIEEAAKKQIAAGGAAATAAPADDGAGDTTAWDNERPAAAAAAGDGSGLSPALQPDSDDDGNLSPALEPDSDDDAAGGNEDVIDEAEDQRRLQLQRRLILEREGGAGAGAGAGAPNPSVGGPLGKDESEIGASDEVQLAQDEAYMWQDKYRPRKPRYFNRVKTGYDWNKYNQMHYDHDNPPPKTVQGYKFNIFYPDLIDRSQPPTYFLEPADTPEFCIIRFHAGPPYEDIAFKIVNGEWEKSHRRGFKSVFQRGVLNVYFNFKRHRYRR